MPIITKISPQKNKKYVNLHLDGKFAFSLDLETIYKFGLKTGSEISADQVAKITSAGDYKKTLNKIIKYATSRPRSRKEIKVWLKRKRVEEDTAKKILAKLEDLGFLDDLAFAKWWVEQRSAFRPKGQRALYYELLGKGIDKSIIKDVLSQELSDEISLARKAAEKKIRTLGNYDKQKMRKKLVSFLKSRGFSWGIVKKILEEKEL